MNRQLTKDGRIVHQHSRGDFLLLDYVKHKYCSWAIVIEQKCLQVSQTLVLGRSQ